MRGKNYKVGKFITDDCTAECNCQNDGRYGCKSLCPTRRVTCRPGQTKVVKHIPVSSRCTCPVPQCISGKLPLFYYVSKSFLLFLGFLVLYHLKYEKGSLNYELERRLLNSFSYFLLVVHNFLVIKAQGIH